MTEDKVIKLEMKNKEGKNVALYLEDEDILALKVLHFANKHDLTFLEALGLFEYQERIARGRLIGQGLKVYGEAFDAIKRIADYLESGKLNARSDLKILFDEKKFKEYQERQEKYEQLILDPKVIKKLKETCPYCENECTCWDHLK